MKIQYILLLFLFSACFPVKKPTRNLNADYIQNLSQYQVYCFYDYEKGFECAKALKKPIFLYFTSLGGIGYDSFQLDFSKNRYLTNFIDENFVTVMLYTDDNTKLQNSVFKTVGEKNAILEINQYYENTQPLYLILNYNLEVVHKFQYVSTIFEFESNIKQGLKNALR
jgi:hypothetical protein